MKAKFIFLSCLLASMLSVSAQDWARVQVEKSPRHGEWITVTNGTRPVQCWVVYPEVKDKATAVLVIHEIYGLSEWARCLTDELAEAGYIAIAPDLLSGEGPNGGKTSDFPNQSAVTAAVGKLKPDQVTGDLNAAADYIKSVPSASGKLAVCGFCWGGGQSFRFACNRHDLSAAFVFYGTPPTTNEMAKIQCPIYGFYAGNDARVSATIPSATQQMNAAGKPYYPVVYDGAGHGFMRSGDGPDARAGDKPARDQSWSRWKDLLQKL